MDHTRIDFVLLQVVGIGTGDRPVEARRYAACEDDREGPLHAGELAVDEDLDFAEGGIPR